MPVNSGSPIGLDNPPAGTIMKTIYYYNNVPAGSMSGGYFERLIIEQPNPIIALIGTLVIFFFVAYIESVRIELPLAHESARGARGRYPIKLIYASNIPVILIAAVLANVGMFAMLFWSNSFFSNVPILGHNAMIGYYPTEIGGGSQLTGGAAW
jgi:preprotein translocase subunit SecY